MNILFTDNAWQDYNYWVKEDRKTLARINKLIRDIERDSFSGIGKPEPLTGDLSGFWSRRINDFDRLIYAVDEPNIVIISCRYHYGDR